MNSSPKDDEITLSELLRMLREQKWLVMLITVVFIAGSVAYAKLATEWFKAEVLLAPAERKGAGLGGSLGALGGLAGIAGIELGNDDSAEAIATLESGEFTRAFIADENLLPVLFADDWDPVAKRWRVPDAIKIPDLRDGNRKFSRRIRSVSEDSKTHLVTLSIEWTDRVAATRWANLLVERLNARMRDRALAEAERNIAYLRHELVKSDVLAMQESVTRLLESEMQKLMLARGNSEYAFRVVDRADTPKWRSSPKRIQVVLFGSAVGFLVAVFVAVLRSRRRARIA